MIFLSRKAYRNKIQAAQQDAMTDLLYQICNERILVMDQAVKLEECYPYCVDQNNKGMLRRFACMAIAQQVYTPWWKFWAFN